MEAEQTATIQKRRVTYFGIAMIVIGVLMPAVVQTRWLHVFSKLSMAVEQMDQGLLILTAAQLVLISALHTFPQFFGTLILMDQLGHLRGRYGRYYGLVAPVVLLSLVHFLIYLIHGVACSLFTLAVQIALCLGVSKAMRKNDPSISARSLVIMLVVFGVQWLHVMPLMDRFGTGREAIFAEIKQVARYMQAEPVLNFIGFLFLSFTLILAALLIRMMVVYSRELARERLDREREQELQMMRMAALEAKAFSEVRSLTHDLKTPLTAIQGLTSVLQLMVSAQGEQAAAICDRINQAADNMNEMITDIIMQERRQPINVYELLTYTTAQVSPKQGDCIISLSVEDESTKVTGNRVRLARALANLLENSLQAMSSSGGRIDISVKSLPDHRVRIVIEDNGPGVPEEDKHKIFDLGFSTRGTAGLGLPFASEVIRNHGGTVNLWSVPGVGTKVVIYLPEVIEN